MEALALKESVTFDGTDIFGRYARATFRPTTSRGWWWRTGDCFAAINPEIAKKKFWRTTLSANGADFNVFEHFGILRYFGLMDVSIELASNWPPHFGCALPVWQRLQGSLQKNPKRAIPWYTIPEPVHFTYPKKRGGHLGSTWIYPSSKPELVIEVSYHYPPHKEAGMKFSLPQDLEIMEEVCKYPSQGVSKFARLVCLIGRKFGWKNYDKVTWPQDLTPEETSRRFVLHRAADLIGIVSLLGIDGLFAGQIISEYSGHGADMISVEQAWKMLIPLDRV